MTVSQTPQWNAQYQPISRRRRERALEVQELFDRGAKVQEIAKYFGISPRMVYLDLKAAKSLNLELVEGVHQGEILGRKIALLENLSRYAMRQCELSQSESSKVGWARLVKDTQDMLMKIFQSTGIITTVPTRFSLEEGNPFTDPEFRKEYVALLKKAREQGIPIFGL